MKNLNCLRCGTPMQYLGEENLQLGKTGWLLGDLPNLFAGALRVKFFRCSRCGKLELFSGDMDLADCGRERKIPQKVCPICTAELDEDCPCCPICGFRF